MNHARAGLSPRRDSRCLVAMCLACALGAGCAGTSTGVRIGDETLHQFEAGVTTEAWVVAILGKPSSQSVVEGVEDTKVLRYSLATRNSGLISMFTGSNAKNTATVYFIVTSGVVTRFWADRETVYSPLGQPRDAPSGENRDAPAAS